MTLKNKLLLVAIIALLAAGGAFYFGYTYSKSKTESKFIHNYESVEKIAELGALEVRGVAKHESKQNSSDNSVMDVFEKTLFEKIIKVEIPYAAKYGVSFTDQDIAVREDKDQKTIFITLPLVKLLSYELRLDKADANSERGLLIFENDTDYLKASQTLYTVSRKNMENNTAYMKQAEEQIVTLLKKYMEPSGKIIEVKFEDRPKR